MAARGQLQTVRRSCGFEDLSGLPTLFNLVSFRTTTNRVTDSPILLKPAFYKDKAEVSWHVLETCPLSTTEQVSLMELQGVVILDRFVWSLIKI